MHETNIAGEGLAKDRNLEDILFSIVGFKEDMVDGHKCHVVVRIWYRSQDKNYNCFLSDLLLKY